MDHTSHTSSTPDRPLRVPPIVWVSGLGLIAALIAVLVFKVAISTVLYYGFFALMIGSHLFMHGAHGGHGSHGPRSSSSGAAPSDKDKDEHAGHSRGCH